ncbi:S1C family serine protease [Paracerasibacillus soli]|uniref:S1C family serine protease n=2 Tax=Paracerasibacillus soli TaxID=480284 RepID=A0ABU5CY59_9BACI|nr:S1C family serine protease [Virgibacillus soli]MDY0410425.1 S1C family serine protease [Virgibacillus soli]
MKIARSEVEGIGFAIPIDAAMPLMEQLETNGEVERPFIGIASAPLSQVPTQYRQQISLPDEVKGGMVIASVEPGSPAEQAGLKQYDVITKINGNDITSILELRKFLYTEASINDTLHIEIYRNGKQHTIDLKLTKKKAD